MEDEELREMGHAIGNHGKSHRRLSDLSGVGLRREVLDGADILASRLGAETPCYAYAFGDIGSVSAEALTVIAEKHPLCRSGVRGLNTETTSPSAILADQIDVGSPLAYQKLILEGGLDGRYTEPRRRLAEMTGVLAPPRLAVIARQDNIYYKPPQMGRTTHDCPARYVIGGFRQSDIFRPSPYSKASRLLGDCS